MNEKEKTVNIEKADKNFKTNTNIDKSDIVFYDVLEKPFGVHGVFYQDGKFRRIPQSVAKEVSEGVSELHACTSGGRIRFTTDSPYVAIRAKLGKITKLSLLPITGSTGFDLYGKADGKNRHEGTFVPPFDMTDGYESIIEFKEKSTKEPVSKMREITINLPLYSEVEMLLVGLSKDARLEAPSPYVNKKPVVYYGHSITMGGCASRPGNSYPAILSRSFNIDFINLGFAGSALGEAQIARYISELDMEMLVYDYDHNAPSLSHLEKTHRQMFEIIRRKNPRLPIIMMSSTTMPRFSDEVYKRRDLIENNYFNAVRSGDENVYFIDGRKIYENMDSDSTVEGVHPNDIGFKYIAQCLSPLFEEIL